MPYRLLLIALILVCLAVPSGASLITVSQQIGFVYPEPTNLVTGQQTNDYFAYIIREQQGVTLPRPVTVNIANPGTYANKSQVVNSSLPEGTVVNSYLLHIDPTTVPDSGNTAGFRVWTNQTFSFSPEESIIGIEIGPQALVQTDFLGNVGSIYSTDASRGLELAGVSANAQDDIILSTDRHTITFTSYTTLVNQDEFRVLTTFTPQGAPQAPEPVTSGLVLTGLAGAFLGRRFLKRRSLRQTRRQSRS